MAKLVTPQLNQAILDAIQESGANGSLVSRPELNPRKLVVQSGSVLSEIWVYVWTLTHGGGSARPKNEYRIQVTGVTPPFTLNPSGPTLLIGYEPNTQCFAGFDIRKHLTFSTRSPSVQIPITSLHQALQDGFSFARKGNDEIAIGFRPDQFVAYALNAEVLHQLGADASITPLLSKAAASEEITTDDLAQIPKDRQRLVSTVSRLSRDASFRRKVITAYDKRCAVTRMQLRLVDAAHIVPVGATGSNDEIYNGLCLSPTYHRAYDRGLIYLDDSLIMHINPHQEVELKALQLAGGMEDFKRYLGVQIHLPVDRRQWPDRDLIRRAIAHRGIAA